MEYIALVATELSQQKELSSLLISQSLNFGAIDEIFTFSDTSFYPKSCNLVTKTSSIQDRLKSLDCLLTQSKVNHFLFTNWDSAIINQAVWEAKYLDIDFLSTPLWIEHNAYLAGNDNFCLTSRRFIESIIDILKNKDVNFLNQDWGHLTILKLEKEFVDKGIKFSPYKFNKKFCYESGPIEMDCFGFSGSANFPLFFNQDTLIPHANQIISRQYNPETLLSYLKNCVETNKVDLFKASVQNFSQKPNLQNAVRCEIAKNPESELPNIIRFFNQM